MFFYDIIEDLRKGIEMKDLETKRYILRKPEMKDAEEIYEKWGTDKEKTAEYRDYNTHKNIIETKALLKAAICDAESGTPFWVAEKKNSKEIIGYIKILEYSEKYKKCQIVFYFLDKWRKDLSPEEVLNEVIRYLFTEEVFETIVIKFYDRNEKDTENIARVLDGIGMKREGILRDRMINTQGQKINEHIYSILKEEWEKFKLKK